MPSSKPRSTNASPPCSSLSHRLQPQPMPPHASASISTDRCLLPPTPTPFPPPTPSHQPQRPNPHTLQAREPYSADTINYIKYLDATEDINFLKFHGWDPRLECARILRISTMLLEKGAKRGLTPFTIGSIMCRETLK